MTSPGISEIADRGDGAAPRDGATVSVLVVDDSRVYRRGMVRAVQSFAGLRVAGEADGGQAALEAIDRLAPDLVLLDLRMPGLDGLDVLAHLRHAAGQGHRPRIVLVSASLDASIEGRALAAGADACLSKSMSRAAICTAALHVARG